MLLKMGWREGEGVGPKVMKYPPKTQEKGEYNHIVEMDTWALCHIAGMDTWALCHIVGMDTWALCHIVESGHFVIL